MPQGQEGKMVERNLVVTAGKYGLEIGTPGIKSVGPLTFGPEGILFVGDNVAAAIFAIDVGDGEVAGEFRPINVDKLNTRVAAYLGCSRDDVLIRDLAVHPLSQNVYLSVMRGSGSAALPVLIKVGRDGIISDVPLGSVPFSQTLIEDAATEDDPRLVTREKLRTVTVTDLAYADSLLLVAGTSNEEFSSTLRRIPFPFNGEAQSNSLEIFHVSHGRYETAAPIRAFVPYQNCSSLLATYTCTPVVHFSLSDFKPGEQVKGKTVAELGAHNRPLDLVSYERDGEEYLLVCNDRHPLFKIACKDIDQQGPLTQPDQSLDKGPDGPGTPPVGVPRQLLPHPGVKRMVNLNSNHVLMMQQDEAGDTHLRSYSVETL
jgi:hypothetical protein